MSNSILLTAKSVSRYYGDQLAVNNVTFDIHKGEVLGFLGPNGAGKTTTMKMLSGNLAPDNGEITINGFDLLESPQQAKAHIGYLPETPPLYKELTVKEYLAYCARLNRIEKTKRNKAIDNVIERCGLSQVTDRLIANLSKGYQQRVGIAQAIIHTPAVVILDEPTSGLDPIQIREIRHLIREIANEHSVILSTHILPEVQTLCDRVQIIHQGELLFNNTIDNLSQQMQSSSLLLELANAPTIDLIQQTPGVESVTALGHNRFMVDFLPGNNPTEALLSQAVNQRWQLRQITPQQHSLEDVFMKIIQQENHQDKVGPHV